MRLVMRTPVLLAAVAMTVLAEVAAAPLQTVGNSQIAESAAYLAKYGYTESGGGDGRSSALRDLSSAIAEFQRFAGLNVTGELDAATLLKMRQPRCGVKDKLGPSHRSRRRRRYALQGSRWRTRTIKYKIESWPSSISDKEAVRAIVRQSFQVWSDVSSLDFEEVGPYDRAQITIRFERYDHGDGDPFDGRGGTLAHAFFPLYGGDAHFDDSERWSTGNSRDLTIVATKSGRTRDQAGQFDVAAGTDVFMTASHEFGHSLGLSHSDDQRSLMAPFYKEPRRPGDTDVLTEDDVLGIQALYGPPAVSPRSGSGDPELTRPRPKPSPTPSVESQDPYLCNGRPVDAMFTAGSKKQTYVFAGSQYWRLTATGIEPGYPRQISLYWDGVPDNLDAAFSWPKTNRIYFFKGDSYWRMTSFKMDPGYPKLISEGFVGIPNNVDAAFRWIGNNKLYFFKDNMYWKFNPSRRVPVSRSYPQPISNWVGIPDNIDSVLTYSNNRTYFFKKGFYYRFDDARFKVDSLAEEGYPRPAGYWWFGCKSQTPVNGEMRRQPHDDPNAVMALGDQNVLPRTARGSAAAVSFSITILTTALLLPRAT